MSPGPGSVLAMADFAVDVDAELGEPSLPSGVHLDTPTSLILTMCCWRRSAPVSVKRGPGRCPQVRECVSDVRLVREIAPEVRTRMLVSPEVVVGESLCHRELCWAVRGPQI